MRSIGMSPWQILKPVFALIIPLLVVIFLCGEYFIPAMTEQAQAKKQVLMDENNIAGGFWYKQDEDFVYIGNFDGDTLSNVRLFDLERGKLQSVQSFSQLSFDQQRHQWQSLPLAPQQHWQYQSPNWNKLAESAPEKLQFSSSMLMSISNQSSQLNVWQLSQLISHLASQQLNYLQYEIEFYNKLMMPILTLLLVWLASSMVFGSTRSKSMGQRIFFGVILAVMMVIIQNAVTPFVLVYQLSGAIVGLTPIVLTALLGSWLYWRNS